MRITNRNWALLISVALICLLIGGLLGYSLRGPQVPGADSVDVGFARDMSDHHRQAVTMAALIYDRTDDAELRFVAYDIITTQQAQIGMMSAWLDLWGHPPFSSEPRMAWMGMSVDGLMPGMATQTELNELAAASGVEADAIFLRLMIAHHRSGVDMAAAAAENGTNESVRRLAQGMIMGQQSEIDYMQEKLVQKGFEPVPEMPAMEMGGS